MIAIRDIPEPLRRRGFTLGQLKAQGGHPRRVDRSDIVRLGSGVYVHRDIAAAADKMRLYQLRALALAREYRHGWLSHSTGLLFLGAPGTRRIQQNSLVHISVPRESRQIVRSGVRCHRVRRGGADVMKHPLIRWLRISSPERLWMEVADTLSFEELVAAGDALVREPYYWAEQRDEPYASIGSLEAVLLDSRGTRGVCRAREALKLIRVGADSAKETAFRLAVIRAGLPEPGLQVPINPDRPGSRCADAGYPEFKIAIQYDGAAHFTPERARADQRRDNEFVAAGWIVLKFNVEDDREGFITAIRQVRAALLSRGWCP